MAATIAKTLHEWRLVHRAICSSHDTSDTFTEPSFTRDAIANVVDLFALNVGDDQPDLPVYITFPDYAIDVIASATSLIAKED